MKKLFIVANWKSNNVESTKWIQQVQSSKPGTRLYLAKFNPFGELRARVQSLDKEIIVCPSFILLPILKSYILNLPADEAGHKSSIKLGAQDISPFPEGSYTGEINGKQIKEFADYVIIGHSERRKYFGETEEMISQKIEQAMSNGLTPIVCISNKSQISNLKSQIQNLKIKTLETKVIIAYEPLDAIGSGNPDTPEKANEFASMVKKELGKILTLYGGSVDSQNVHTFTQMENIDGVLVGKASLDPSEFLKIIQNA